MTTITMTIIILTTRVLNFQVGKSVLSWCTRPGFVPALILILNLVSIYPSSQNKIMIVVTVVLKHAVKNNGICDKIITVTSLTSESSRDQN